MINKFECWVMDCNNENNDCMLYAGNDLYKMDFIIQDNKMDIDYDTDKYIEVIFEGDSYTFQTTEQYNHYVNALGF